MNNIQDNNYPKYIRLTEDSPYKDGRVVCNGIRVTTSSSTFIVNRTMMKKLDLIKDYIEEVENV